MEIEKIKKLVSEQKIKWSEHCLARMGEREISIADIESCVLGGEIIEDYPDDYPHPSCLIFGDDVSGKKIHVVTGSDGETVYFITAYIPDIENFKEDLKTRRI